MLLRGELYVKPSNENLEKNDPVSQKYTSLIFLLPGHLYFILLQLFSFDLYVTVLLFIVFYLPCA